MALVPAQNKGQLMERNNGPLVATEQALIITTCSLRSQQHAISLSTYSALC